MPLYARMVDEKDVAVLRLLDGLRTRYAWVPAELVRGKLPWSVIRVDRSLAGLERMGLVQLRHKGSPEVQLLARGLDTLALWELRNHGAVARLGDLVGAGKEAVVVNATAPDGAWVAVKLHRYYQLEFEGIRRSLAYAAVAWRREQLDLRDCEVDIPRAKAQVEMTALEACHAKGVPVPRPYGLNRHVVVAEMVLSSEGLPAPTLQRVRLSDPEGAREAVLAEYSEAVTSAGVVHGDLSEFNILVHPEGYPVFIDWPQAVPTSYPLADRLLERDLDRVAGFFAREHRLPKGDAVVRRTADELGAVLRERREREPAPPPRRRARPRRGAPRGGP